MRNPRDPDLILVPGTSRPMTGAVVTHAAVQIGTEIVHHLLADWRAESEHVRRLGVLRAAEDAHRDDLDRLERVATIDGLSTEQRAAAVELLLELIAERHQLRLQARRQEV